MKVGANCLLAGGNGVYCSKKDFLNIQDRGWRTGGGQYKCLQCRQALVGGIVQWGVVLCYGAESSRRGEMIGEDEIRSHF